MNWERMKKNVGYRVQLLPIARRLDEKDRELPSITDDWIIDRFSETEMNISNVRTGHSIILGKDHIHNFATNPNRTVGGIKHGFLTLHVQVFMQGRRCWLLPNTRPGEAVKSHQDEVCEKWVDNRYPSDIGIQQKLEADGYRVAWCLDTKLARKIDLEGWEVVLEPDEQGVLTKFRIKDRPSDLTLIKTKSPQTERIVRRSSKRCPECGYEQYLGKRGITTLDSEWFCPNESCPSKRRF